MNTNDLNGRHIAERDLWRRTVSNCTLGVFCCGFLSLMLGCGPSEVRPKLYPGAGELFINEKPATGAMLVFYPVDGNPIDERGSRVRATVKEDGSFHATTYQDGDGLPAGEYEIAILWFSNPDSPNAVDLLNGAYSDPKKGQIKITAVEGSNSWEPIRLDKVAVRNRKQARQSQDSDGLDQ